tara:strand:- start:133 stop:993 length:861 start_codon:yes stop_codon:yes gene_type:complete
MFGHQFYHQALRKYIIMFGNMFNDIYISRKNNSGTTIQTLKVPISYGPKEKFLARLNADPNLNRTVATQLPRLAFEITNMTYAADRTVNKLKRNVAISDGNNTLRSQYVPVPYDLTVSLYGMFAGNEDAVQVVEQILPFFRPEWTNSVKLVPEMGHYYDVPTILNDMSIEDTYEADFQTRRAIIYTFNFTVKGLLFGPVSKTGIIRRTYVDFTVPSSNTATGNVIVSTTEGPQSRLTITPGVLANGSPTSNSSASIAVTSINANNTYGFAIDHENFFDGLNRHHHE